MAFVWRRGGAGSVRLLISNKQKVTSLKNRIFWAPARLHGNWSGMNRVGFLAGACWLAFERSPRWFTTFLGADRGDNLAFRSLKWRCWADSCVIMLLLPTRVGEKKSQVNAGGEAARRHPAPEATPDLWSGWKTGCCLVSGWRWSLCCLVAAKLVTLHHLARRWCWRVNVNVTLLVAFIIYTWMDSLTFPLTLRNVWNR